MFLLIQIIIFPSTSFCTQVTRGNINLLGEQFSFLSSKEYKLSKESIRLIIRPGRSLDYLRNSPQHDSINSADIVSKSCTVTNFNDYLDSKLIVDYFHHQSDFETCLSEFTTKINSTEVSSKEDVLKLVSDFACRIQSSQHLFNAQSISSILTSLQKMSSKDSEVLHLITALLPKIEACTDSFTPQQLIDSFQGLQNMDIDSEDVLNLISTLTPKIHSCSEEFSAQAISSFIFSLHNMKCDTIQVAQLLSALTPKIQSCSESFNAQNICDSLRGLRNMNSESKEVVELIAALTPKIQSCTEPFNPYLVSTVLQCLGRLSSGNSEVLKLIAALVPKVQSCKSTLRASAVGKALIGFNSLNSHHNEVLQLLVALTSLIIPPSNSSDEFDAKGIHNALFGLQGMSSDHKEVLQLVDLLTPKVEACRAYLSAQTLSHVLFGLQSMSSDCPEVQRLIASLIPKLESCKETFTEQGICSALYGLQRMSSDHEVVRKLISAMIPKIQNCREDLSPASISSAMHAFRGLSSSHVEVQNLLLALIPKINTCEVDIDPQIVGAGLCGMQRLKCDRVEVLQLIAVLVSKVEYYREGLSKQLPTINQYEPSSASLSWLVDVLRKASLSPSGDYWSAADFASLVISVKSPVKPKDLQWPTARKEGLSGYFLAKPRKFGRSAAETFFMHEITSLSTSGRVRENLPGVRIKVVDFNTFLHGFEADVVVKVSRTFLGKKFDPVTVNVEIDGPSHVRSGKQRQARIRDARMRQKGVLVLRWDLMHPSRQGLSFPEQRKDFDAWFVSSIKTHLKEIMARKYFSK